MKIVSTALLCLVAMLSVFTVTGCASSRDAMQKEYTRLASTRPEPPVRFPQDRAIDNLGVAIGVNYAFAHKLMKEYVDATENNRDYIGFMNDIKFYMNEEGLDEKAATEKVIKGIQDADAKVTDPKDKVWPRVVAGINAVDGLKPETKLKELAVVIAANANNLKTVVRLKDSFKGFDALTISKGVACVKIAAQATFTSECLAFVAEQFRRTLVAKYYAK